MACSHLLLALWLVSNPGYAEEPAFQKVSSPYFTVHYEANAPPTGILSMLEGLRHRLLLDLILFAPWAKDSRIDVFLYADAEAYRGRTGAAPWTGAHADLGRRSIHTFDQAELRRILAHELAHLFFDDYFMSPPPDPAAPEEPDKEAPRPRGRRAPLWLTEGVATAMEWDYGLDSANPFLRLKDKARWLPLKDFLAFDYHGATHESRQVSDWYLQAYGVTQLLLRRPPQTDFAAFCAALREGSSAEEALKRAYGYQIPDVPALERLWRDSLE